MNKEIRSALTGVLGITQTHFATVTINVNSRPQVDKGQPIGAGNCIAVQLFVNPIDRNTQNAITLQYPVYYGDRSKQEIALEAGKYSELIFCKDLSEVYVRSPNGVAERVQILIHGGDETKASDSF